jgi:hypothetical protein
VFSVGAAPRLFNGDLRPAGTELREFFEAAVEDDGEDIVCHTVVCEVK